MQAAAFLSTTSGGGAPGGDLAADFSSAGGGNSFQEFAFAGVSSASATASASGPGPFGTVTNTGSGTAEMGRARMRSDNSSPIGTSFAVGLANGGWKETFTVSHPSFNGQAGFLVFLVRAQGTLTVTGQFTDRSGAASLTVAAYKDNIDLMVNPFFDRGDSDPVGSDRQRGSWSLGSVISFASRPVNGTVTLSVPITFGQPFTLGVYARAAASQGSQVFGAPQTFYSSATTDFLSGGVTWEGIASVRTGGGAVVSGSTIISGSGINWSGPFAACPCTADFDGSGGTPDASDIDAFFTAWLAGDPAADADCSGGTPDASDIDSFFVAWLAGGC